jgi:tetratricopeptide (TPR) repeat protein
VADYLRVAAVALGAAKAEGDRIGQAAMRAALGRARWRAADRPGTLAEFTESARLAAEAGWTEGEAHATHGTGLALKQLGRLEEASAHYRRAADRYREVGDVRGEAGSLNGLGAVCLTRGRLPEAEEALRLALPLAERTDQHLRALVLANLGTVSREQALLPTALAQLEAGLRAATETESGYARALLLEIVGHVHGDAGHPERARTAFAESVALARRGENPTSLVAGLAGLAGAARQAGQLDEAEEHLAEARRLSDLLGAAEPATQVLLGEAALLLARGRPADALPRAEQAGRFAAAASPLDVPRARLLESRALAALGETARALAAAEEAARLAGKSDQRLVRSLALEAAASLRA